ncbi:tyrosine-type recombinase/integrase [Caldivirga sp.]|uniref:tyrosine-type recombinase/integrase n=1 Tax=Caldivirga sp. TaxID=2080243 RepID=UPI0025BDA128|nr:tyrosine-type recombinase/integrase [Caldivirga sp.]
MVLQLVGMDPSMINVDKLNNETRRRILEYVLNKGVKPGELGYEWSYVYRVRVGRVQVSDDLVKACIRHITREELVRLVGVRLEEANATPSDAVRVIRTMQVDPAYRDLVFSMLKQAFGEYLREAGAEWIVKEGDLEDFIKAKRLRGLSEKTIRDEVRYVRQALIELNWRLNPDALRDYLSELREESEYVLKHTAYSLKSLLKEVLRSRDPVLFSALYYSFRTVKPMRRIRVKLPELSQLRELFSELPSIEAKAYFMILAETGLRPSEPLLLGLSDVDWEHGVLRIGKVTATKRAFIAFLRPESVKWLKDNYMPVRDGFVKLKYDAVKADYLHVNANAEDWASRLIPFNRDRLRREIKKTARAVLGRDFELYELRKFFATWMISQGVPESIVNTLQGRAPPSEFRILIEHYWSPRHEELRQWYLKHAPAVCCG